MGLVKIFFWGMLISFMGTLPMSNLNITAMQISLQEGISNAMYFSLGTLVAEMIIVRIAIEGFNWVRKQKKIFRILEWVTFFIIAAFAAGSFIAASQAYETKNILLNNNMNRFLLGGIMSTLTPTHIPFWFGWSTILFSRNVLKANNTYYNVYVVALGLGTFLANYLYIYGGKLIVSKFTTNQHVLNLLLGFVFGITALIQLAKIIWFKSPAEKLEKESIQKE
jgi:hypothetical protein